MMEFHHRSVLLDECIDALSIRPDGNASALLVEANALDAAAETAHLLELMERDENQ